MRRRRSASRRAMLAPLPPVGEVAWMGRGVAQACERRHLARDAAEEPRKLALAFACAVGSRVCTRLGAVAGLPRHSSRRSPS